MHRLIRAAPILITILCVSAHGDTTPATISEQDVLDYAARSYDKNHITQSRVILGSHGGAIVLAEYICSDVCPDYTVRVIHYELRTDQTCSDAGGIEKKIRIPVAIAAMDKMFCFPKVLVDNWDSYKK